MIQSVPSAWYYSLYQDKTEARESAKSFTLSNDFMRACLLVHGYAGYPGELVSIANYLYTAGFDCYVPRLPGMGTSGEDFSKSGLSDWLSLVDNAITDLCLNYQEVYAVGHSMGCALIALADEGRLERAVMAAPAIKMKARISTRDLYKLKREKRILDLPWKSDASYRLHYENAPADDEYYGKEYWSHLYPSQMLDLYDLMERSRPAFSSPRYKVLYGSKDEICSYTPALLKSMVNPVRIKDGTHYLYYDRSEISEMQAILETRNFLDGFSFPPYANFVL